MSELDADDKDGLVEAMRARIVQWGATDFLCAPILEPTDRFFPDPYTPDLRGVRNVARRLMRFAQLGDLSVSVSGVGRASDDDLAPTEIRLSDVRAYGIELSVSALGRPEDVPLVLAPEIARAVGALRGSARPSHPYRAARDEPESQEEERVCIDAVHLGFALLIAMGSHQYRATGEQHGNTAITRWVHRSFAALDPEHACYALAVQCVARGLDDSVTGAWKGFLGPNQAALVSRYLDELRADPEALRASLGLSPDDRALPWNGVVEPLADDGWRPDDAAQPEQGDDGEEDADEEEAAPRAYRVQTHWGVGLAIAAPIALVLAAVGTVLAESPLAAALFLAAPFSIAGGYFLGRRVRGGDVCGECGAHLPREATCCEQCRAVVIGEVRLGETRLDAEERARQASIREAQRDAPRYSIPGLTCVHCGWVPDGESHWDCEHCAAQIDVFEDEGRCTECAELQEEPLCPSCGRASPLAFWSPERE